MVKRESFNVDTGLFRELGELLVGRDSTALMELVKNAYDADATYVALRADGISSPGGTITIEDDGIGMTESEFRSGFLTIAGRSRLTTTRRSKRFGRRYSGAKGVGRLAAHKLAAEISIATQAAPEIRSLKTRPPSVDALIDWDTVESYETMDQIASGVAVETRPPLDADGTRITLRRLRRSWPTREINRFLAELEGFRLPPLLSNPPAPDIVSERLLFDAADIATRNSSDPGFELVTEGDFSVGDDYWDELGQQMSWVIEVEAKARTVHVVISPTNRHLARGRTSARSVAATFPNPARSQTLRFQARIFVREQAFRAGLKEFARRSSGVRLYMDGFRVLPYGEQSDDWLGLDREYVSKPRKFEIEPVSSAQELKQRENEGYYSLGTPQYFGAVFLKQEAAPGLEMVVSREGFVPNQSFEAVREIIRTAIHLSVRNRAAVGARDKAVKEKEERERESKSSSSAAPADSSDAARQTLEDARAQADRMAKEAASGDELDPVAVGELAALTSRVADQLAVLREKQALTRVLASVGSEMAAFVHELNGIVSQAQTVRLLAAKVGELDLGNAAPTFELLSQAIDELIGLLGRQSSYIVDVLGVDATGRRSGQRLEARLAPVLDALSPSVEARRITVATDINPRLRTPAMFPAEVTIILRNLLTNAIKAAGSKGRIRVEATTDAKSQDFVLRVQNTGSRVDLKTSERWFEPFESTTTVVDPVLGQGMGLGLTIVRDTILDYGGSIRFTQPTSGFRTSVEVRLPHKRRG